MALTRAQQARAIGSSDPFGAAQIIDRETIRSGSGHLRPLHSVHSVRSGTRRRTNHLNDHAKWSFGEPSSTLDSPSRRAHHLARLIIFHLSCLVLSWRRTQTELDLSQAQLNAPRMRSDPSGLVLRLAPLKGLACDHKRDDHSRLQALGASLSELPSWWRYFGVPKPRRPEGSMNTKVRQLELFLFPRGSRSFVSKRGLGLRIHCCQRECLRRGESDKQLI